ncbi:PAS domain S-box-containing protein [Catalinimonas alkaloidigena]|uniref:histidine kinase n=1 Tax=Catalinimonas alkaloidigena TaxID=1075417 RepID=A0A1G9P3P7_9BACT|nr:PAS domain S-box protein [Catalinimonas alkaloidigena]SDL93279.1 PAS domain S-box-containing protein [Catalinimonas alkaloidigena]
MSTTPFQPFSDELFRTLVQQARDGILVTDSAGHLVEINPKGCRLAGYTRQEMVGMPLAKLLEPELLVGHPPHQEQLQQGKSVLVACELRRKDGSLIWVEINAYTVPNCYIVGIVRDITQRKKHEEALQASAARFRALVDATAQIVWTTDAQGAVVEDSPSWRAFTGQSYEEWKGFGWLDAFHPDDRERVAGEWQRAVESRTPLTTEYRVRHRDGGWRWTTARTSPVYNRRGVLEGWVGMNTDITERKQIEAQLQYQASLLDNVSDAVIAVDRSFQITSWNPAAEVIYGWTAEEAVGKHINEVLKTEYFQGTQEQARAQLGQLGNWQGEVRQYRRDGQPRTILSSVTWIKEAGGQPVGAIAVNHDVTEHRQMTEALQQSEARFSRAFQVSPAAQLILRQRDNRVIAVNETALKLLELRREDVLGQTPDRLGVISPELMRERQAALAEHGEVRGREHTARTGSGRVIHMLTSVSGLEFDGEACVLIIGIDITERKQAESALVESERRFRQIAEGLPQLVWTCNADGCCEYLNDQWIKYTGVPAAEQLDYGWLAQLHPDDRLPTRLAWDQAVTQQSELQLEYRLRRHDGVYRWFEVRALRLQSAAGDTFRWFGTNNDIEDRKQAAQILQRTNEVLEQRVQARTQELIDTNHELQAANEELQAANEELHASNEHVSTINAQLSETTQVLKQAQQTAHLGNWELAFVEGKEQIVYWSEEMSRIFQIPSDPPPTLSSVVERLLPEHRDTFRQKIGRAIQEGVSYEHSCKIQLPSGGIRYIESRGIPIWNDQGQFLKIRGISQDITARRKLEEELQQANTTLEQKVAERTAELQLRNQELVRINTDLDNFLYMSSHDLKHPITNLEGLLDMQSFFEENPVQKQRWEAMMRQSIARLRTVISHITEISKVQRGLEQEAQEMDIGRVLESVQQDLAFLIKEHRATFEVKLEVARLRFIPKYLHSILQNLISNAIKYRHPDRTPLIKITTHRQDKQVVLAVQDNGLGIPPKQQKRLFKMFQRLHTHVDGAGIGLYMTRRMIENYGGQIQVESQVDVGTTFRVYLDPNRFAHISSEENKND